MIHEKEESFSSPSFDQWRPFQLLALNLFFIQVCEEGKSQMSLFAYY